MKESKLVFHRFLLLSIALVISGSLYAQQRITGRVTNSTDGQPVVGVNVVGKGTTTGVRTDLQGNYEITVPSGTTTLDFSFIGFVSKSVLIGNKASVDVILEEDVQLLNEVVVVGYGEQSRSKLTTSVSKLDTKVLKNVAIANAGSALQGTVSGLRVVNTSGQPGASLDILMRGGASINNPGAPLVVIDGIVRTISDFNPADIESVQVLKDAASTAIYGARANNGVILITSKKGKYGTSDVTYKVKTGFNFRRNSYNFVGARDYIHYNRLGVKYLNANRTLSGAGTVDANSNNGYGINSSAQYMFDVKQINATTRPLFQDYLDEGWQWMIDPYTDVDTLIFKDYSGQVGDAAFNQNPFTQDHHLSFTGGNETAKFAASVGYYDEDGLIIGTKYKRYTGTLNGSYMIKKNLEVTGGLSFNDSKRPRLWVTEPQLFYRITSLWPTWNPYDEQGNPASGAGNADGNPLYWLSKYVYKDDTRRTTFNLGVKWDIIKDLSLSWQSSVYYYDYTYESFTKASLRQNAALPDVSRVAYASYDKSLQQQHDITLNYKKSFGLNNLSVLAGGELFDVNSLSLSEQGQKAPTDDIYTLNASVERTRIYSSVSEYKILSGFGRVNYDYDGKYLFTFVARYDGISKLAEANRWGFFPGVSVGWNIQLEDFFKNSFLSGYITTLKPRVSYGINGNVAGLGDYEVQGVYSLQPLYSDRPGFLNTGMGNQGLRWEKSNSFEAGFDLGLFKNKIMLLANYYNRVTSDLLTNLALPGYTGFANLRTNLGSLRNSGLEAEVIANILEMENSFRWDLGLNASYNTNKVLKLPANGNDKNRQGGLQVYDPKTGQVIWVGGIQEGETLGDIYAYKQERILRDWNDVNATVPNRYDKVAELYGPVRYAAITGSKLGKFPIEPGDVLWADLDKNDTIDFRDRVRVGNEYPKFTGGFSSTVSFKGFSLYSRFDYAVGHTIYNDLVARILGQYQGTFNIIDWVKKSWTPDNVNADISKFYYADQLSKKNMVRENSGPAPINGNNTRFYEKGDYLAVREITLTYDLPKNLISKASMSAASVYITGQNIAYLTKYTGTAPELGGVDAGRYPLPKSFIVGLQLSF
jgi:TonB-linked SusC/RagA family outer membrane protein